MRKWMHTATGKTVELPDHQVMIPDWKLVQEEVDHQDLEVAPQTFTTMKDLRTSADKASAAFLKDVEYRYTGTAWKKVQNGE